jgi:hypothetical protein
MKSGNLCTTSSVLCPAQIENAARNYRLMGAFKAYSGNWLETISGRETLLLETGSRLLHSEIGPAIDQHCKNRCVARGAMD